MIRNIYVYFPKKNQNKNSDLPYLGAQIRCAQNRYATVQTELKYLLNKCLYHHKISNICAIIYLLVISK